ncbi:DUF6098 family protein [Streptomyces pactum]|uniref:DUF6098 family protein n=1 Tax=Streptomyces pactum TaxID=68249 RepID=UPI000A73331E|nr:DUF6098 family protein [Streptomyces pactum]
MTVRRTALLVRFLGRCRQPGQAAQDRLPGLPARSEFGAWPPGPAFRAGAQGPAVRGRATAGVGDQSAAQVGTARPACRGGRRRGLYVRWFRGPERDLPDGTGKDDLTGVRPPGSSARPVDVEARWGGRPVRVRVARLYDYCRLPRLEDPRTRPWLWEPADRDGDVQGMSFGCRRGRAVGPVARRRSP